jgi:hypothetical protein
MNTKSPPDNTVVAAIAQLHSRYNPQAEADRYINSLHISDEIQYFILLEPGLGYLIAPLKKPGRKIIALHADAVFRPPAGETEAIPAWYPDSPETIQEFLGREIPDIPASGIRLIEWRPGLQLYGVRYVKILSEAADFIRRADANYRTNAGFGRRWFRNFFKNLKLISGVLLFNQCDNVLIVTGSGPSLEDSLFRIQALKSRAFIIAASSSVLALQQGGIDADLVISTDGGAWAKNHLYSYIRHSPHTQGLAVSLCAALPSQCAQFPLLILNDGSLWQTLVLSALGIPSLISGQRGTVTASAVECALELSRGPVFIAGMDLSVKDIRTHVRPYTFDAILSDSATRLKPLYTGYFKRAYGISDGKSLEIYAAWFRNRLQSWPRRIYTLDAHSSIFETTTAAHYEAADDSDGAGQKAGFKKKKFLSIKKMDYPGQFYPQAVQTLQKALNSPRYGTVLCTELSGLLFPGEKNTTGEELSGEIEKLTRHCGAYG